MSTWPDHLAARFETGIARLGECFDYIGGANTGSIIAAGLAVRMSAAELLKFYDGFGTPMFEKTGIFQRLTTFASNLGQNEPVAAKLKELHHADAEDESKPDAVAKAALDEKEQSGSFRTAK